MQTRAAEAHPEVWQLQSYVITARNHATWTCRSANDAHDTDRGKWPVRWRVSRVHDTSGPSEMERGCHFDTAGMCQTVHTMSLSFRPNAVHTTPITPFGWVVEHSCFSLSGRIFSMISFVVFLSPTTKTAEKGLRLGHDRFFPHPLQLIILLLFYGACPESKDTKVLNMYSIFHLQKWYCEWIACR
jgi:hypothetical protein